VNDTGQTRIYWKQWRILIAFVSGVFIGALDISIVSPAIPVIIDKLSIGPREIPWIISLYLLVYVISTPLMTAFSDRFGRKKIFLMDLAIFGAGSLWAALSPNFTHLLVARGIQALGAGGLFPIAGTVIGETFPKKRRGLALGFLGLVWGIAAIVGPPAGGWLTQWLGWPSIFFLNLPLTAAILIYGIKTLPDDKGVHKKSLDIRGMILLALGLGSLVFGLNKIDTKHLFSSLISPTVWPWALPGIVLLFIFIKEERRTQVPVISPHLFSNKQLDIGFYLGFTGGITEAGLVFLPLYITRSLNKGTGTAGTLIAITAATFLLLTEPMSIMVDRMGVKAVLLMGTFITALGAFLLTTPHHLTELIIYLVILGVGLSSLLGTPARYLALSETDEMERASAQGLLSLVGSFGTMVGTTLAGAFMASHPDSLQGFHEIYLMIAVIALIGGGLTLGLKSKKRRSLKS
jgi:EmrB/QacA subfamily drug resistance transporter